MRGIGHIGMSFITVVIGFIFLLMPEFTPAANEKGVWLITPEEAAMAPKKMPRDSQTPFEAEVSLGPIIEVLKPSHEGSVLPPVEVDIKFLPRLRPVDLASLKVTVVKLINIDITDRVLPYASSAGIHVPAAQLPSGRHIVRVSIADQDGLRSAKELTFVIIDTKP